MLTAWRAGNRQGALKLVPHELIDEIFIAGTPDMQRRRLEEFASLGVTTQVLTPLCRTEDIGMLIQRHAPAPRVLRASLAQRHAVDRC